MTIDEQLEQLAHLQYPRQVDVTDRVMEHVMQHRYMRPVRRRALWQPVGAVAAAAAVILLVVNVVSIHVQSYDEAGMGNTLAQVNDYSSWNTVEESAVNPIEYMYEE